MPLEYKGSLSRYRRYLQTVRNQPLVRASIWVMFSLTLTIVMILTALKPTLSTIASLIGQIEQEKKLSIQLDEKIRAVQTASLNLDNVREKVPLLNETMPDSPQWKELAMRLESEATNSGISLDTLVIKDIPIKGKAPAKKTPTEEITDTLAPGVYKVDVEIMGTGDYSQMRDFLSKIQRLRRIIVASSININKSDKGMLHLVFKGYAVFNKINAEAL